MRIHKAWYGPKGGHALLHCTEPSLQAVFRQAAWLTDLPGTAPAGLAWAPYFRTGIQQDYFVLVHTRPSQASDRAGMVDSVAAFVPLNELAQVPDMRALAANVRESHDNQSQEPFEAPEGAQELTGSPQPMLLSIADAFISPAARPVVHVGQAEFDDIMLNLLQLVPKQLRREVLFSLSFAPGEPGEPFVVAAPRELASRFAPAQVLKPSETGATTRVAALLNLPEGRPLLEFGQQAGFDLQSPGALVLLDRAFELWTAETSVENSITLVRLLASKSSDAPTARELRAAALERLTSTADQWTPADVLAMRNLPLERFEFGALAHALQDWVARRAGSVRAPVPEDRQLLAQASRAAAQQDWWNRRAQEGFAAASKASPAAVSLLAWGTMANSPQDIEPVLSFLDEQKLLTALSENAPATLAAPVAQTVAQASASRQAWGLCGAALAAAHAPTKALSEVLNLATTKGARRAAIEPALKNATPAELVALAVSQDLEEVTALAANAVVSRPSLIGEFDWTSPVWFDILQRVADKRRSAAAEVPSRIKGLQSIIAAGEKSKRVWAPLVSTGLADLSKVPNRADAWALIPGELHRDALSLTAKGWVAALLDGSAPMAALEEPLGAEVRMMLGGSNVLATVAQKHPALFISVITEVHPRSDHDCVSLLDSFTGAGPRLAAGPAAAIGALIRERFWRLAASRAASLAGRRDEFLTVCKECLNVMPWWESFHLSLRVGSAVEIRPDEAWQMFEETLAKIYPAGPIDQEVWSRSRGRNEDLNLDGTGLAQWHRCLKRVRSGNGPRPSKLLDTALRDFGDNPVLQVLRDSRALG
ncbi:effector-associated domain EAD1-containing protein [Methyloversatilis sp.]|uniref:GAP1-N1 domain-containing protein n=1 Tax=Methyloversatilis sp. TaxID=2569862 RepID=UPI0035AFC628